jgi:hypothetical protein
MTTLTKQQPIKRSHKAKLKVSGYTRKDGKVVQPYKRTKSTKKRLAILKRAREVAKKIEATEAYIVGWQPSKRGTGWKMHRAIEPEERVVYTYKVVILVKSDYKYRMFFVENADGTTSRTGKPRDVPADAMSLQYWHSKFEPTIKGATIDFLGKVPEIRAYGDVQFISIELYRVSGVGKLTDKNWKLIASFDEPEDVK